MPVKRALIVGIAMMMGAAALGALFVARSISPPSPVVVPRSERAVEAPPPLPETRAARPRAGRVLTVDEAVKDLDLIRPSRQKLAENFTVALTGGTRFRLADQRGKVVLINFWATWCPPCREEMPAMERLWRQHKDNGFVLLAVSVDAKADLVPPFVGEHKLTFPVAVDAKMDVANLYGVKGLPSSFIVDPKGTLTALAIGPRAWDNDAAHSLIERMAGLR
jgi:peroxiredoxin